ncbi:MAG: AmmeMemoRadiSam system protein B [Deltaproteobacteria bacterium CG11_big_fil_rev_8_21_14_0_20_49_13]|nr:MAG: AmmeMemoRadiSam system protein B [Deltaproteobacteria bacterium CG11_big_fil_rev_8_21_14_0_20_49_13]
MIRKPAVAGQFYPASKVHLEKEVKEYLNTGLKPRDVVGLIAPHAGYIYSGGVAGAVFSAVNVPDRVIVLSPNHTGMGTHASIMTEGEWELPTGNIKIDGSLAKALVEACPELKPDTMAHTREHSLEVELPFLQAKNPAVTFVPITLAHIRFDTCEKIGKAIAKVIKDSKEKVLIVASSDMTHYETHETAKTKDGMAIAHIHALDAKGLLDVCGRERITMCGVIPAAIMIVAAIELGAKKSELIKYATSGDVSGDYDAVVGYAGFIVY